MVWLDPVACVIKLIMAVIYRHLVVIYRQMTAALYLRLNDQGNGQMTVVVVYNISPCELHVNIISLKWANFVINIK